jgi:hypothetical protein
LVDICLPGEGVCRPDRADGGRGRTDIATDRSHRQLAVEPPLLDTGLWSFNLLAQGGRTKQQLIEAAKAAEDARKQVVEALRQARRAWRDVRHDHRRP